MALSWPDGGLNVTFPYSFKNEKSVQLITKSKYIYKVLVLPIPANSSPLNIITYV